MLNATRRLIAVVDDEASMCRALQRLLRLAGFEVDTFSSGDAFLGSLEVRRPDCLILDLQMPGMTGFEVQARLAERGAGVPIITITGYDSPASRERALSGGARVHLRKPVSERELLAAIDRCTGAHTSNGGEAAQ